MQTVESTSAPRRDPKGVLVFAAAAACVLIGVLAWQRLLSLSFFGWDAYPLIATSQIHSFGDLGRVLGAKLMAGRYPLADFYRPLVQLSFALDHARWDLEPWGYHLTDLVVWIATSLAAFFAARRMFGSSALVAAFVAGAFCALHPLAWDVLPAPARRADALASFFTLLAIACAPLGGDKRIALRAAAAAFFSLAAFASKESGVIAAPLVFVVIWCGAELGDPRSRFGGALRAALPSLAVALAFFALHVFVLGGLGGSAKSDAWGAFGRVHEVVARVVQALFPPLDGALSAEASDRIAVFAIVLLIGVAVACSLRGVDRSLSARRPLTILLLWTTALVFVTGMSGEKRAWYALPFVPIVALLVGYVAEHGVAAWRARAGFVGPATAGLAFLFLAYVARESGLMRPTPELLVRADKATVDFFARFDIGLLQAGRPGTQTSIEALKPELVETIGGRETHLLLQTDYSVQAYADLKFTDLKIRVERGGSKPPAPPASDEYVIVLQPPKSPE